MCIRDRYQGEFADGLFEGEGKLYSPEGILIYQGGFKEGVESGTGKQFDAGGVLAYDGEFLGCLLYTSRQGDREPQL